MRRRRRSGAMASSSSGSRGARRLPRGDSHKVEVIFGVRRLEACRRASVRWRAEVRQATFPDSQCAALMHGENEWTEGVSHLENAL